MEVELKDSADFSTISVQNYVDSSADLPIPEKEGFNFLYWSFTPDGEKQVTSSSSIKSNSTLYAIWERKQYWITVYGESGTEIYKLKYEDSLTQLPTGYFEKEHYDLVGWTDYGSGEEYPLDRIVRSDLSIIPEYEKHKYTVTLFYEDNGFSDSIPVEYGQSLSGIMFFPRIRDLGIADFLIPEEGEYDANTYADFFTPDGKEYDANSIVDRDLSLSVVPKQWFNVVFYSEGEVVREERVFQDSFADGSPLGNKNFFVYFGGWKDNGSDAVVDLSQTPVKTDLELSAVWIVNYRRIALCALPVVVFIATEIIVSVHRKKKKQKLLALENETNRERALKEAKELEDLIETENARIVTVGKTVNGCILDAKKYEMYKEMEKLSDCLVAVRRMEEKLRGINDSYSSAINSADGNSFELFFRNAKEIENRLSKLDKEVTEIQQVTEGIEKTIDNFRLQKEQIKRESDLSIAYALFGFDINKKPTMKEFKHARNYFRLSLHPDTSSADREKWAKETLVNIEKYAELIEKDLES